MKIIKQYLVIFISISLFISCTKESKNNKLEDNVNLNTEKKSSRKNSQNTQKHVLGSDCKAFFESIDFSSFCFSNNKTPKFEVGKNYGVTSRCQYRVSSDKGNFDFLILISTSPDKFKNVITRFDLNKKTLKSMGYKSIKEFNGLGDQAYIAYNEESQIKELHLVSNNVTIKIELSRINKHKSCLYLDLELKQLVRVILESLSTE